MVEDDDGRSWELTVRGLKRRRRLRFPGGVAAAPAAGVDRRQWGLGACSLRGNGGGWSSGEGPVWGWRRTAEEDVGGLARCSGGVVGLQWPDPSRNGRAACLARLASNTGGPSHQQVGPGP
jgi:hypothetical protein